jgi:hypothetical protein
MDWMELAQDRDRWREIVTAVIYSNPNIIKVNIKILGHLSSKSR